MSRSRFTVRVRLTLLYACLFAVCGGSLVAVTYVLVAGQPDPSGSLIRMNNPQDFLTVCREAISSPNEEIRRKCDLAFQEGVVAGAQGGREATLASLLRYSLITLGLAIVVAAFVGWVVAGRALRPVHRLTAAARAASDRNLSARVALTGPRDELRELADTFDAMLARLQAAFESQGRFIANAGHELRTPLAVMRTTVDVVLAKPDPDPDELRRMGTDVRAAVEQAERLITALLTLARNERGLAVYEEVDLATVGEDVADEMDAGDRQLAVELAPAIVRGDPVLLERLLSNLVENAVRYNVSGGRVWLETSTVDGSARLTVANTGPVVPGPAVASLFEPFRRLHERTGADGFGLGLTIVASIAAVHGGRVTANPRIGGGLVVTVVLPAAPAGMGRA